MDRAPRVLALSLLSAALLAACSSDSGTPAGGGTGATTTLTVTPSLGRIFNAAVEARCAATGSALGSGTTGTTGTVTLTLTGTCTGPVILEVLASGSTTYFDEQANAEVAMPSGTQLRTVLASLTGLSNVAVTPLTEIAFQQALADAGNVESAITALQATTANSGVAAQVFGATAAAGLDILQAPTVWDSSLTTGSLGTTNADRYAYLLAALAGLGGSAAAPALAATQALATDLADGALDGATTTDVTYTAGDLATQLDTEFADFAAYAGSALQTALGIETGGGGTGGGTGGGGDTGTFPDESITLPASNAFILAAADLAGAVGTYTGTTGVIIASGVTTPVDSCSITVAAGGTITVTAGDTSISQTVDGGNGDASVVSLSNADTWTLSAGGTPGTNVATASLNIDRGKMIDGHAYIVANTSVIPTVFTQEVKCWMPINRVVSSADSGWNSRDSSATASDFPSAMVGTYTGTLFSDNGILAPAGSTCTATVASNGSLTLATAGNAVPVSLATQIAGDEDDRASFTDDLNWILRGKDVSDPVGNASETITLQSTAGTLSVNGARKTAGVTLPAGWACTGMTKQAAAVAAEEAVR